MSDQKKEIGISENLIRISAGLENTDDLLDAIKNALKHYDEVLIEEYINGVEVSCGVFKSDKITALPITEIVSENEFFDFEAKYQGKSEEITPARINTHPITLLISKYWFKIIQAATAANTLSKEKIIAEGDGAIFF